MGEDGGTLDSGDKDRNFVTALARGLEVLRCFRRGEVTLTNSDFAERTGLPKATISRLTYTLCELDYLVSDPVSGTYRLGAGVLQLGYGVLSAMDVSDRIGPVLRALRDGPNSYITAALGEAYRLEVIYLAVERSREDVSLTMRIGSRLSLLRSAVGRAILAGASEERQADIICMAEAEGLGDEARAHIQSAQSEYTEKGYCSSYGDWRQDVNGIAVPVRTLDGSGLYGLNVGGPSFRVKKRQLETVYAQMLRRAAAELGPSD